MIRRRLHRIEQGGQDAGVVAILFAMLAVVLFGLAAIAVDVSMWYVAGERAQKAADAAALAGVTYLPQDINQARTTALAVSARNGIANGGGNAITAEQGVRPSQLRVSVTTTVTNGFANLFGMGTTEITRESTADFHGPAPMGSPCNTFGNEPASTGTTALPVGSSLPTPSFPNCSSNPMFWANIQGPATDKVQGDQYMTRRCTNTDRCSGGNNQDFQPRGYFFVVRVLNAAATGPIQIQLYDPAFVNTQPDCSDLPVASSITNNMNSYTTTDGRTRYADTNNNFCTGDYDPGGSGTLPRMDTSFALRAPIDTQVPQDAPVISGCTAQYKGKTAAPTATELRQTNELTRVFHQWIPLCTITNPVAGDYYLQVRTNVALPGGVPASQYIVTGNSAVTSQAGDNTAVVGRGSNAFGIRAVSSNGQQVSVAGYEKMPIFANATNQTSTFNLIRAMPGAAGKSIEFSFYDAADGATSSGGTVTVSRPTDATGSITGTASLQGCTGSGVVTGNLANCAVTVRPSTNNGRIQTMRIPVPSDYSCNYLSAGGCWFKATVSFPGSTVTDITTWTATLLGDPVRIVK